MMKGMGAAGLAMVNSQIAWRPGVREIAQAVPLRFRTPALAGLLTYTVAVTGQVSFVGDVSKTTTKVLSGQVSFVGTLIKSTTKLVAGSVSFIGTLSKSTGKVLDGAVSFVGTLLKSPSKSLAGSVSFNGDVTEQIVPAAPSTGSGGIVTVIAESAENSKLT